MSLHIKNSQTDRLVRELARRTGESMTGAVDQAVRERLERLRAARGAPRLAEKLVKIGKECASHLNEPYRSTDHGDLLYDEKGLPK